MKTYPEIFIVALSTIYPPSAACICLFAPLLLLVDVLTSLYLPPFRCDCPALCSGLLHSREEPREDGNKKEPFADMKGRNKFISTDERSIHESDNNFSQPSSSQRSVAV